MFKNQQPLILFLTILISSCTTSTQEVESTIELENDVILSQIDSVLSYADSEIENIIHNNEESEKEYDLLINEIKRLKTEVNNRNSIIQEITTDYNELSDSLTSVIDIQNDIITQKEYTITNLEDKLYYKNSQMVESTAQYEAMIFRLEDSLSILNVYIDELSVVRNVGSTDSKRKNRN